MFSSMAAFDTDDWEAINDNGFVYKRRKRLTGPTSFTRLPDPDPNPNPNPNLENKLKLKKRREILVHVKDKYQKELALWDNLVKSFNDFEARAKSHLQHQDSPHAPCNKGSQPFVSVEDNNESLLQELLFKVEAQEAIIRNFEQLCDVVDSFCDAQEEKAKQVFFNLPIWNSPRELMASLSED